jgi:hypothetical protein
VQLTETAAVLVILRRFGGSGPAGTALEPVFLPLACTLEASFGLSLWQPLRGTAAPTFIF